MKLVPETPLDKVLEIMGAQTDGITAARDAIAKACGVSRSAVGLWADAGIPSKHVLTLEALTKRKVTVRELLEWSAQKRSEREAAA